MKAVVIRAFGSPDGLEVVETSAPVPAAGQVLIASEAIGVSGADVLIRSGALGDYGFREGHVPGSEVAGTVTAVGEGVDASWIGRRVWAFTGTEGGYVEQVTAPAEEVLPLPEALSPADATALGSSGAVAHFALAHAGFTAGESVLVRGAAGSIGIMAVQLAARGGASAVAVTTSSAERGERLRALGATQVLDRSGEAAQEAGGAGGARGAGGTRGARGAGGTRGVGGAPGTGGTGGASEGYDVVIDIVAGPDLPSFLTRLNPNGRLVAVGAVGGMPPADFGMTLMAAFRKSLSFATFSAATVAAADLRAVVHELLPLEQAASAHRKMDAGEVFGRIVLVP
ncbi:zinc-binding dehydrogenase [Streptomyces sp. NPDC059142]|uniref:zinc-binding dehydrogenase n=1 Tax=Streptomyces sp. NPDC059142 TaxID=3346739 RepID=UPI0036BD0909